MGEDERILPHQDTPRRCPALELEGLFKIDRRAIPDGDVTHLHPQSLGRFSLPRIRNSGVPSELEDDGRGCVVESARTHNSLSLDISVADCVVAG